MIIATVVVDQKTPLLQGKPAWLCPLGSETALEHLLRTVVRGPFGVTIVASTPHDSARVKELLSGFAVQHVEAPAGTALLSAALKFGRDYRERWQKVMSAAKARFGDEEEGESRKHKPARSPDKKGWAGMKGSADVKVRGLARSFDRDGVMIFPADHPAMTLELQAQLVEAFAREASDKGDTARPLAQPVHAGERGYPILADLTAAAEIEALPSSANFDHWLLQQLPRIQDVPVQNAGAVTVLRSEEDRENICKLLKIKPQP